MSEDADFVLREVTGVTPERTTLASGGQPRYLIPDVDDCRIGRAVEFLLLIPMSSPPPSAPQPPPNTTTITPAVVAIFLTHGTVFKWG